MPAPRRTAGKLSPPTRPGIGARVRSRELLSAQPTAVLSQSMSSITHQESNARHQRRARAIELERGADLRVRCMPLLGGVRFQRVAPSLDVTADSNDLAVLYFHHELIEAAVRTSDESRGINVPLNVAV